MARSDKHRLRKFPRKRGPRRSVPNDELGAGQIEREERFEIFFDRQPADRQKDRPRQVEIGAYARVKQPGVHAARPQFHIIEAARRQFGSKRWSRRQNRGARRMKTPKPGPCHLAGPPLRHRQSLGEIIGKSRVKAGGKRQAPPQADATHGMSEWAFRCQMNCIRSDVLKPPLDTARAGQRQPDFRIARHG